MANQKLLPTAQARRDAADQARTAAFTAFSSAKGDLDSKNAARDQATQDLADVAADVADLRKSLAGDLTPAELQARIAELRDRLVDFRHARHALLDAEEAAARAAGDLDAARAAHELSIAALADAEAGLAEETANTGRRQRWSDALAQPPVSAVRGDATAALAAVAPEPFPAAKARVEGDVPADLRTRAIERRQAAIDGADEAAKAAAEADEARRPSDPVAAAWADFRKAEAALGDYVSRGPDQVRAALGRLSGIVASPALDGADAAEITDAGQLADRQAAKDAEKARDDKAAELAAKRAELAKKILDLKAADVDVDLDADTDVQDLRDDVSDLEGELGTAETAFTADLRATLDGWEAAVPDPIWANLLAFLQASDALNALKDLDPATLTTDLATAEDALVTALTTADKAERSAAYLAGESALRHRGADVAASFLDRRQEDAVRGDQ